MTTAVYKILHIEDDEEWADLVTAQLDRARYRIHRAKSGEQGRRMATEMLPDLAILDMRLPDISGHELCRRLREIKGLERLPIVVLSSHGAEKTESLRMGADVFVDKDSGVSDLQPAVEALLRRVELDTGLLLTGDLKLDPRGNAVFQNGKLAAVLPSKQFKLFYALVGRSPQPVSRAELRDDILHQSGDPAESRSLEMLVVRLRKNLGKPLASRIKSGRGFGWRYVGATVV